MPKPIAAEPTQSAARDIIKRNIGMLRTRSPAFVDEMQAGHNEFQKTYG